MCKLGFNTQATAGVGSDGIDPVATGGVATYIRFHKRITTQRQVQKVAQPDLLSGSEKWDA